MVSVSGWCRYKIMRPNRPGVQNILMNDEHCLSIIRLFTLVISAVILLLNIAPVAQMLGCWLRCNHVDSLQVPIHGYVGYILSFWWFPSDRALCPSLVDIWVLLVPVKGIQAHRSHALSSTWSGENGVSSAIERVVSAGVYLCPGE